MARPAVPYFLAGVPGWIIGAVAAWALWRFAGLPGWLAVLLLALWILKDIAAYPAMRRFYRSEPAEQRMVGQVGQAVSRLAPRGQVRVRGELWQAVLAPGERPIEEGGALRVLDVQGLTLVVGPPP